VQSADANRPTRQQVPFSYTANSESFLNDEARITVPKGKDMDTVNTRVADSEILLC
jgi:hypothetical protein